MMDRLRSWRSRGPEGHGGAWRAGLAAIATAGLAVLLAVLFHLDVAAVVVAILGGLPSAYLAWKALPGTAKKPAYGHLARQWGPVDVGVHQVIGGGPMPAYVRRPHDELLRAVLDPAIPASRLVVVRGGSSTGKTRAAWEAVAARLADWRLDYPQDPAALEQRLEAGIPARTVLWLGELRQYADTDGGAKVLGRLADLLQGEHYLLITTIWPEDWDTYVAAARAGHGLAGPASTAGRLLEALPELTGRQPTGINPARGGVIDVPPEFTATDLKAATIANDPVLAAAATAAATAGKPGQVTQYLAGVPDLLRRYAGRGGDPYGQAIITAAMDATRLGHASLLPAVLLTEAAVGYLTDSQRTRAIAAWRDTALDWATAELRGAVRAVQPIPPPSGTGVAGYQVADYLDRHGRRTRQDQLGPPSLWDALIAHTVSASDLTRLGQAARDRGLYRHASALWTAAATLGSAFAVRDLIAHLRRVSTGDAARAARWAMQHASLDDPYGVGWLLRVLRETGDEDAARTLAAQAARHVSLDNPDAVASLWRALHESGDEDPARALAARAASAPLRPSYPFSVAWLLRALHETGDEDAARALAARAARHASIDNPEDVAWLLRALHDAGGKDAAWALLARDPVGQARLDNPGRVADLLQAMHETGNEDAARALAARAARHASLDNPRDVAYLLESIHETGDESAARALAARAVRQASLDDPYGVASLLRELRETGDEDAARALLARDPADHVSVDDPEAVFWLQFFLRGGVDEDAARTLAARAAHHTSLDDPYDVASLLRELRQTGAEDAAQALATRAAHYASLDDPNGVARLLEALREAGDEDAARALLARDPAGHASLDDPHRVAWLLRALRESRDEAAARALATRAGNAGMFDLFMEAHPDEASKYRFGREPNGTPSQFWEWQDPTG